MPVCRSRAGSAAFPRALSGLTTWLGARWLFYFLLLTSLCLSTLLGKILKGMDPVLGSNLEALHAARCYTFLGIFTYSAVSAFFSIQQLHLDGGREFWTLCWEAEPFFLQNNPKPGKSAALVHRQPHLQAGPRRLVPRGSLLAMLGYR